MLKNTSKRSYLLFNEILLIFMVLRPKKEEYLQHIVFFYLLTSLLLSIKFLKF